MSLAGHLSSTGPSVNACWTFCPANRCTGVPKIVYMVTSQCVKFIYILCKVICNTILKFLNKKCTMYMMYKWGCLEWKYAL